MDATMKRSSGDTKSIVVRLRSGNEPISLVGYTFYFTVKNKDTDADVDALIDTVVNTFDDPASGIAEIPFVEGDTSSLSGNYCYGLTYKDDDGETQTILSGVFTVAVRVRKTI